MTGEDVAVGDTLPALHRRPGRVTLFRFAAVTWNAHRIHYDAEWAREEGYPDVIVQSHLHGCLLVGALAEWFGESAEVLRFRWENRRFSVADERLVLTARVTGREHEPDRDLLDVELEERNDAGELCTPAWATLAVPRRAPS